MDKDTIKQELLSEIEKSDCFTFVDLIYFFENHDINPYGDYKIGNPDTNVLLWVDLSDEVAGLILEMFQNDELFAGAVDREVYSKIGAGLCAPMAKKIMPSSGYKKPHWQPVIFRTERGDSQ